MDEKELAEIIKHSMETTDQLVEWLKQNGHNDAVQRWWLKNADFFTALVSPVNTSDETEKIKLAFTFGCYLGWNESR